VIKNLVITCQYCIDFNTVVINMALSSRVKACYINFILLLVVEVLIYISGFILWLSEPSGRLRGKLLMKTRSRFE
ncbi:MAG: hypothetical protein QXM54_03585, partial [Desulfurococcaceae archaeon]